MAKLSADQSRIVTPPSVVIAGALSASAFAVAVLSGVWADRAAASTLADAIVALVVCYPLGLLIGKVATIAVDERAAQYMQTKPLADLSRSDAAVNDGPPEEGLSVEGHGG